MTTSLVTSVALFGSVSCGFEAELARAIQSPVVFQPLPDTSDLDSVEKALQVADVVVGGWPEKLLPAPRVRLVQHVGAGVEGYRRELIPQQAYLCNAYSHESSLAEHVWMMALSLRRGLLRLDRRLRQGKWNGDTPIQDIAGVVMGIIGFGRIGHALLPGALAFGVEVIATAGHEPAGPLPDGVRFLGGPQELDKVLEEADILVVACPLNDRTRGMIGGPQIAKMRRSAILINVARGPVVDETALYEALRDGRLGGAGIDVWYEYPSSLVPECLPSKLPFHNLDNVLMTPHVGGWSFRTKAGRIQLIAANIDRIAQGEEPQCIVWRPPQ